MHSNARTLPDGTEFPFWEDQTRYERTYHVAREHPEASDENPGAADQPFQTIGQAAAVLEPGERVLVHSGVYRESVRPQHGGEARDNMIKYTVAPDADVVIRGSEIWDSSFEPSDSWDFGDLSSDTTVWTARFPEEWFNGYNPFGMNNVPSADRYYLNPAADGQFSAAEHERFMHRRGMVFFDGIPLSQVYYPHQIGDDPGTFWVDESGLRIHFRAPGDGDPADAIIEVTTKEQLFAPAQPGLGFIHLSGFTFEHAADGIPIPQRAMVSANLGHHWIIANNRIQWANACGIDVGDSSWHRNRETIPRDQSGHHIIRNNHISHCGACGIASLDNNKNVLVEGNLVEHIGSRNIERVWETAGLKFHLCENVLIRNNVFRHIQHASGIWLDFLNKNTRVSGNVVSDVQSIKGGLYLEVSHDPVLIDQNVLWDIRGDDPGGQYDDRPHGHGINVDTGENTVVAHNLVGHVSDGFGISASLDQAGREVNGRVGLCRNQVIRNNVLLECPHRVHFGRSSTNECDGNLYDEATDDLSFLIRHPEPERWLNLSAWQDHFGFDTEGRQAAIDAEFDGDAGKLSITIDGTVPIPAPVNNIEDPMSGPGPFELEPGHNEIDLTFPD